MAGEPLHEHKNRIAPEIKVAFLGRTTAYPDKPARIDVVETHMSWVFLTNRHAYKLKKPVRYDFLDFSTLAAREQSCKQEVRLNRRLAKDIYLGAVPLTVDRKGDLDLDGQGEVVDWLVKMRRLPADRMLDTMIRHHTINDADVHNVATVLADFYKQSPPVEINGEQYRTQFEQDVEMNYLGLAEPVYDLPGDMVETMHEAQSAFAKKETKLFERRVTEGRIIEGHGDLRPEHICIEHRTVIFDCLEFNRNFRIVDTADELAFLAIECERIGAPFVGLECFRIYTQETGDHPPESLVFFYKAYRACVRARLSIWHVKELERHEWPKWRDRAMEYLYLAEQYSQRLV